MLFCFTGAMQQDRSAAEARVKALGGGVASSVTTRLTHLVAVETGAPSTKLKAARALIDGGSKLLILDEAQFNALVSAAPAPAPDDQPSTTKPTTQQLTMF
jgi:NAD-dependent DNA ligase